MKLLKFTAASMFTLWTVVQPVWAQSSEAGTISAPLEEQSSPRLSDLGVAVNPQLGVSNFEYSDTRSDSKSKLSGGLTFEFGGAPRKMETGLLVVQTEFSQLLTIPMMAKLRLISMKAQSWYAKFGFMPAFEMSSTRNRDTNNLDVIGSLGLGGRLAAAKNADFIIEATYNRGILDASRTGRGENYNQGVLVLAGMSFSI